MFLLHNDLGFRGQVSGVRTISLPRPIALKITSVQYKKNTDLQLYLHHNLCSHIHL